MSYSMIREGITLPSGFGKMFPTLTAQQIMRISVHGNLRKIKAGEVLAQAGERAMPFFVLTKGQIKILRPSVNGDTLVAVHEPGQFTGETNMLSGRPSLVEARVTLDGEVIELSREKMLSLVQTDSELSDVIMRAFILRRVELISQGLGDVVLIGSNHCAGTLRIKEFLTRNGHPFSYIDLDHDADVQQLLDNFRVNQDDIPVIIYRGNNILRNPANKEIADVLGFNEIISHDKIKDVVIVGAGPAGLAAAVYGASEGLDVLVLESNVPGGQAGSSSKIENYLGFPTGISGQELTARAYSQAQKFGVQVTVANEAVKLICDEKPYIVDLGDDQRISAKAIIIATGAKYRKPALENISGFEGAGIYYGATAMEAQLCIGEEVIVVGGGNSAGQAAVFLSQNVKKVYMLVRSSGLSESMSRYLIRRIEDNPAIELLTDTELIKMEGGHHLESVTWRNKKSGAKETNNIRHVFFMAGAVPHTGWLEGCLALDNKGFIKTGTDISSEDLIFAKWPLNRPPHILETSLPGVFAVGDVRGGSIKRVASAVGEGAISITLVHKTLHE